MIERFYIYQKERFPMIILVLSLFPAILSSGAVVSPYSSIFKAFVILLASLAYLFHIRSVDEHRDFNHDNKHHWNRPIQTGMMSRRELEKIDIFSIILLLGIALYFGIYTSVLTVIMLSYSYLAGKEFFLGEKIRKHFFFYNSVNLVQMLILQIFVYLVFDSTIPWGRLLFFHFLFTTIGTIVFEFMRKLKIPGKDGTGKDTYTWYLGFGNSILIYLFLAFLDVFLFLVITNLISNWQYNLLIFSSVLITIVILLALIHWTKKKLLTEQLMQLSFLLTYMVLNLIIYFKAFY